MNSLTVDKVINALGVEPARFRYLEMVCGDFISAPGLTPARTYTHGDVRILREADRLLRKGLGPAALKARLGARLGEAAEWASSPNPETLRDGSARLLSVSSGKGGVGKSNIALNLAVQLVRLGLTTVVLDADLGVANLHVLAGVRAQRTLRHVISGECGIEEIITPAPGGPDIIPGSSGMYDLANLPAHKRHMLLSEFEKLENRYNVIIVDTAAGVAAAVIDFVVASDFAIVVTMPEATAITDAYALMKLSFERAPSCRVGIVANRVKSAREGASALGRISGCARRFLGRSPLELGYVWEDSSVRRAVNERMPFSVAYPHSKASLSMGRLAKTLVEKCMVGPASTEKPKGFGGYLDCVPLVAESAG
jgi:flagellar biosynthesis protein FlhG